MKRAALFVFLPALALATPSGKRWQLQSCTSTCTVSGSSSAGGNLSCTMGRCLPEVRFAASVGNTGGMTITGAAATPYNTALTSMRTGFERWTTPNVTTCGTSFMFAFQPNFTSPSGTSAISGGDGNNNVIWFGGTSWRYGSGTLGLTTTSFFPGRLLDADMELNNNSQWSTTGASGAIDIESVVTHEAGHFIGFSHTTSGNAVMNPSIAAGVVKRALLAPDLSDVCGVYPGAGGGLGSSCTSTSMCTGGRVCEGPAGGGAQICTQDCAGTGSSCPAGYTCQASSNGFGCLPQVGVADQCRFCTRGSDCSTGICLTNGNGINYCSQSCTPGLSNQCTTGSECVQLSTGSSYCVPTTTCTNQCTTAGNCAPGYACQGGTCTPTGAPGDRCEVSNFCQNCGACVTDSNDPNTAFCRACCNGASTLCTGCTATTCAAVSGTPTLCSGISGRAERFCFPESGALLCQGCSTANPCATGLTCFVGVCRATCNPSNPGSCPACLPQGATGYCACTPAEIAEEGQPCSAAGPLLICRAGLACAAGRCRVPCSLSMPGSCGGGMECQMVGSETVCVPAAPDAGPGDAGGTGTGGGGGGGGGGTSTGGGSASTCGPGTCDGCCEYGVCVPPANKTCGNFGAVCRACADSEVCEVGQCVAAPKAGCGCAQVEVLPLVLLGLALLRRRERELGTRFASSP